MRLFNQSPTCPLNNFFQFVLHHAKGAEHFLYGTNFTTQVIGISLLNIYFSKMDFKHRSRFMEDTNNISNEPKISFLH